MSDIFFSIIICTKGRPEIINILHSIANQKISFSKDIIETIVIDSSTSDTTKKNVKTYGSKIHELKYFSSNKRGISFARNIGIQKTKGLYICFVDDDVELSDNWINELYHFIKSHKYAQIVFGEIYAVDSLTRRKEEWIKKIDSFTPWVLTSVSKSNFKSITPYTANVCIHRDVFSKIGKFNEVFANLEGPVPLPYGEDPEFFQRARNNKAKILFSEKMKVKHFINIKRSTLVYLFWRYIDDGKNSVLFYMIENKEAVSKDIFKYLAHTSLREIKNLLTCFPLGLLYFVGKNIGSVIMIFYLIKYKSYYNKFLISGLLPFKPSSI